MNADYWNKRAIDINKTYGNSKQGFTDIPAAIDIIKPNHILDYGCGSGRFFSLYDGINFVAVDISIIALHLARVKCPGVYTILGDYKNLKGFYDLIICNSVLSALEPDELIDCLDKFKQIGSAIYVNEYQGSDTSDYWFSHDYSSLGEFMLMPEGGKLFIL
jgi:SAM-dependent methyltransferase